MVSDAELADKVHEFLRSSDLKKTTNNTVIKKLEQIYGSDLSEKKSFLRQQVDRFLQTQYEVSEEEEEEDYVVRDDNVSESDDDEENDFDDGLKVAVHHHNKENNNNDSNNGSVNPLKTVTRLKLVKPIRKKKENDKKSCTSRKFCTLSPQLQNFLGVPHMIRAEVVKFLWTYAKEKKLQDPRDGKNIICDETLRDLFGVDSISILQINRALTQHIRPQEKVRRKDRPKKQEREEDPCEDEMAEKRQKKAWSGFLAPLPISDTFIKFLGTGETALTRPKAIKKVWEYIKDKGLQDPSDKKTVICDEKLKELFNVDSFLGFDVTKLLTAHFVRKSSAFHPARDNIDPPTGKTDLLSEYDLSL